jgi:hypothetical protein
MSHLSLSENISGLTVNLTPIIKSLPMNWISRRIQDGKQAARIQVLE